MPKLPKPAFITLEGIEGSGKTSQLNEIINYFKEKEIDTLATREPGGTPIANRLREILLCPAEEEIAPLTELLLYNAARSQHITQVIQPALAAGTTVICDRFADATLAYQAYGRGLDLSLVSQLNQLASEQLSPDLTLLFDCDPEIGITRSLKRLDDTQSEEDRFEQEAIDFHHKVRHGYLEISKKEPNRFIIIDANQSIDTVTQAVQHHLQELVV